MFGPPGVAYVYFIYGMHHCLNAVTEPEGVGAAVLIRAVNPLAGAAAETTVERPLLGPGLVCRGLGIDLGMNGWDLTDSPLRILAASRALEDKVLVGPRVGISSARALPLRYRLS
jgi:DNA-3-methyladenine glycosylase